ncbi:MAG: hypothetical protein ACXADY_25165, partial [Candidatus Hodarchaeales archaeon]
DGKEILFSTPKSLTKIFLENSLVVVSIIALINLLCYLVSLGLLYINDAWDAALNLTICFFLAFLLVTAIAFLTAFGCTINFSKTTGYTIGGLYIIFSIVVDLTANQISDLDSFSQLSLFSQSEIVTSSLTGTWNEDFILLVVALIVVLIIVSIVILHRKDFLEKGVQPQIIVKESEQFEEKKLSQKLSYVRAPMDKLLERLGWKHPAVRDQLHANATVFIFFLGFMIFYSSYVIGMYVEEEVGELLQSFNMPFMQALLFGNNLQDLPMTMETYLAFEIFSFAWMVIAPFILIVIYDIIMRDYKKRCAEITWTFPKTKTSILVSRTIAGLIYFIVALFANFMTLIVTEVLLDRVSEIIPTLTSYLIFIWGYCIIFVFFLALALLVPSKHALKTLMVGYVFFVLVIFIAFLPGTDLSLLRFLSPFGYFDSVSIILGQRNLIDVLPEAIAGTFLTVIFYIAVLKIRVQARDYQV